jgi:hypothetical protein
MPLATRSISFASHGARASRSIFGAGGFSAGAGVGREVVEAAAAGRAAAGRGPGPAGGPRVCRALDRERAALPGQRGHRVALDEVRPRQLPERGLDGGGIDGKELGKCLCSVRDNELP